MRAKVSEKGQVTVPKRLREQLDIRPGDELDFLEEGGRLVASKAVEEDPVAAVFGILGEGLDTDSFIEEVRGPADPR